MVADVRVARIVEDRWLMRPPTLALRCFIRNIVRNLLYNHQQVAALSLNPCSYKNELSTLSRRFFHQPIFKIEYHDRFVLGVSVKLISSIPDLLGINMKNYILSLSQEEPNAGSPIIVEKTTRHIYRVLPLN